MNILEKMEAVLASANRLNNSENQIDTFNSFSQRTSDLEPVQDKLIYLKDVTLNFKKNIPGFGLAFSHNEDAKTLYDHALEITEQVNRDPDPNKITQNRKWKILTTTLPNVLRNIETDLSSEWKKHLESIVDVKEPHDFEGLSGTSDDNRRVFKKYEAVHEKYMGLIKNLPKSKVEIEKIKVISEELRKISEGFSSESLTPEITAFLNRLGSTDGAELRFLTEEVLQWLQKQKNYKNYRIHIPRFLR